MFRRRKFRRRQKSGRSTTTLGRNIDRIERNIEPIESNALTPALKKNTCFVILGCTDLRISLSEAKFDAEADFDVRSAVAPPKPYQIDEKLIFRSEKFPDLFFLRPNFSSRASQEAEILTADRSRSPRYFFHAGAAQNRSNRSIDLIDRSRDRSCRSMATLASPSPRVDDLRASKTRLRSAAS